MPNKRPTLPSIIVPPLSSVGRPNTFSRAEWERLAKVLFRLKNNPPAITPCVDQASIQFREARDTIENRVRRELTREGFDPRDWYVQAVCQPRSTPRPREGELYGVWELHLWCAGLKGPPEDAEPLVDPKDYPAPDAQQVPWDLTKPIKAVEVEVEGHMKNLGCCADGGSHPMGACNADTCMDLGESTCADCVHEARCVAIFGAKSENRYCQFFPRRFAAKGKAPVMPQGERVHWEPIPEGMRIIGVDEGVGESKSVVFDARRRASGLDPDLPTHREDGPDPGYPLTRAIDDLIRADTQEAVRSHHARVGSVNGVEEAPPRKLKCDAYQPHYATCDACGALAELHDPKGVCWPEAPYKCTSCERIIPYGQAGKPCPTCKGAREVLQIYERPGSPPGNGVGPCPTCKGSGIPQPPKHGEEAVKQDLDKQVVQEVVGRSVEQVVGASALESFNRAAGLVIRHREYILRGYVGFVWRPHGVPLCVRCARSHGLDNDPPWDNDPRPTFDPIKVGDRLDLKCDDCGTRITPRPDAKVPKMFADKAMLGYLKNGIPLCFGCADTRAPHAEGSLMFIGPESLAPGEGVACYDCRARIAADIIPIFKEKEEPWRTPPDR